MEENVYFLECKKITAKKDGKVYNIFKYLTSDRLEFFSKIIHDNIFDIITDQDFELFEPIRICYEISKNKKVYISDVSR